MPTLDQSTKNQDDYLKNDFKLSIKIPSVLLKHIMLSALPEEWYGLEILEGGDSSFAVLQYTSTTPPSNSVQKTETRFVAGARVRQLLGDVVEVEVRGVLVGGHCGV